MGTSKNIIYIIYTIEMLHYQIRMEEGRLAVKITS